MVCSITKFFNRRKKISVHSFVIGMRVSRGARYGLFEFSSYIFLSCADWCHYGEVILRFGDAFYWPLLLSRGGHSWDVSIRVNAWNFGQDEKSWPLRRGGHCREVAISRGLTVSLSKAKRCPHQWKPQTSSLVLLPKTILLHLIVSITKYSPVIGSLRAYLLRNCSAVTWVSNYSCPI